MSASKVGAAIVQFRRQRLVCRWSAAKGGGNISVLQFQPIAAIFRGGLIGKSGAIERLIEKISGAVAGEHAPGAICAMGGGRQSNNQQLCARIAEAGHRLAPVFPIAKGGAFLPSDHFAVVDEARAAFATNDLLVETIESIHASIFNDVESRDKAKTSI